jgi:hypothetical protein
VPLSKGQPTTNINRNTNNNVNYNILYDYLFSLLQNNDQDESIETPIHKPKPPVHKPKPPVHKPTKPCQHPGDEDDDEDDGEDDGSYKPETSTEYNYHHHTKPTISIHKPYRPHGPSYNDRNTVNRNSNIASNTNVNDAMLAGEGDINSEISNWGKAAVKRSPETVAAKSTPEAVTN